ncbi:MAG TPA: type VI secretion system contractile sheath large subunit [Polyangia bacterium]|nr:type VI secretion system contractile sheath large subunit [Polyangia bacterium]
MAGRMEFQFQFAGKKQRPAFGSGQAKLRLLLVGDFSGRQARGASEPAPDLARRPVVSVDLDGFDQAMGKVAPVLLPVPTADSPTPGALTFTTLDDFHPDQLCQRLEVLAGFRALRARLLDPSTFAATAAALEPSSQAAPVTTPDDTVARLLGGRRAPSGPADMEGFLREVVAPHISPAPDARQPRLVAAVDEAAAHHLRALLHAPAFQRLESSWRALHRLVASVDDAVSLSLLDVSRAELGADLAAGPDGSGLHRRLSDDADPWSLVVLDESFGPGADDLTLLSALGAVAAQLGVSILAGADPRLDWGALDSEAAARWRRLRQSPQAGAIGLALPRWLLRLPYGPKTDPIESFPFDELGQTRAHDHYLWGNPAFACAQLAAAAFRDNGARMQLGDALELDDLPAHTYREDGEAHLQPYAEIFMPERVSVALLDLGLMPLISARDRNSARLARFQSIADPSAALVGPWR